MQHTPPRTRKKTTKEKPSSTTKTKPAFSTNSKPSLKASKSKKDGSKPSKASPSEDKVKPKPKTLLTPPVLTEAEDWETPNTTARNLNPEIIIDGAGAAAGQGEQVIDVGSG